MSDRLTSVQRPIPLRRRADLRVVRMRDRGAGSWVVKDPIGLKYHRLQPEQHVVLERLDGTASLDDLKQRVVREFPTLIVEHRDIQRLVADLHQRGLLTSLRPGRADSLLEARATNRRKKRLRSLTNILYLRLPGFDAEPILRLLNPWLGWLFSPAAVVLALCLAAWSLLLVTVQFDAFCARLPAFQQFFGWPNVVWLWFTMGAIKVVHEVGHGLACRRFGAECHEIGVMVLVLCPTMYTDATDSWMLRNKWHRIAVAAAGMYVESTLAALAVFVWWNTRPGLVSHLALNVFFISSATTVIFNANPLLRYDGYYILSDFLEVPNLRPKSDRVIRDLVGRHVLGLRSAPDPFVPERGRGWLALYGVAAWTYRLVVMVGVSIFLYQMLKPWGLEAIGAALAGVSVLGMVTGQIVGLFRMVRSAKEDEMNATRASLAAAAVCGLLVAAAIVPLPLHVRTTFQIQPHDQRDVYVTTPGELVEVVAKPGERVRAGDVLARFTNPEIEDAREKLRVRETVEKLNLEVAYALDDDAREQLALEMLAGTREALKDAELRVGQLTLRAPVGGVVVAAPRLPEAPLERDAPALRRWHGTPLDARNVGTWMERQTHVASVAPDERMDAILFVDQSDRPDIAVGQHVELRLDHLPDVTFAARVADIARRDRSTAPQELSQKLGGDLTTTTDAKGREKLASVAYQVTVVLETGTELLQPGMQGTARFLMDRRSAFDWAWRAIRQTIHFRL